MWLVGGSIGGPYFGKVDEVSTNDRSSFLPESADATQVNERLPDFLGDDSIPAVVVVTGEGALTDAELADIQTLADDIADVDGVLEGVSPPIVSEDGEAAQIFVPIDSSGEVRDDRGRDPRARLARTCPSGLEGWVTGPAGFTADLVEGFLGIDGLLLVVALIAVFVILVIVYRSPLLPILVLLTSVFALCVALLTVWWLAYAEHRRAQRSGAGHPLHPRDRRRDRLCAAVRRALPRGDRAPARGDGMPTTRAWRGSFEPIIASGGTVIAGLALPAALRPRHQSRARTDRLDRHRVLGAVGAHLPACTARALRTAAFWPFIPKRGRSRRSRTT